MGHYLHGRRPIAALTRHRRHEYADRWVLTVAANERGTDLSLLLTLVTAASIAIIGDGRIIDDAKLAGGGEPSGGELLTRAAGRGLERSAQEVLAALAASAGAGVVRVGTDMELVRPARPVLAVLRRTYLDGVPQQDYPAVLVVLGDLLSEENLAQVTAEFTGDETVVVANGAAAARSVSPPAQHDVARGRAAPRGKRPGRTRRTK